MGEIAYTIDKAFWAITFVLFIASMFVKLDVSSRIALAIWLIGNLAMDLIQPTVMVLSTTNGQAGKAIWYLTWSSIEILCLWCIYKLHTMYQVDVGKIARFIMLCLLALCCLQVSRYADRFIFQTNFLAEVYRFGIIAINISVLPATALWLFAGIKSARKGLLNE